MKSRYDAHLKSVTKLQNSLTDIITVYFIHSQNLLHICLAEFSKPNNKRLHLHFTVAT